MINNIPKNWEIKTLAEVCTSKNSNIVLSSIENNTGKYPIYGAKGFLKTIDFYTIENESLGIVKDGAGVGRIFLLPEKSSLIGTMAYIQANENLNLKYLYYFLHTINFNRYISGSAIPHIYFRDYKKEKIPLPPLEIQKAIVEKLENAFAHIDEAVRHLKAVQTDIPRLKSSLLHCAFSGKLTESPLCHSEGEARRISKDSTLRDISGFALNMTNGGVCHSKPLADEESKPSCHTEPLGEVSYKSNKDISLVSQAQYDTIALTQNQIAFSKYPAFIYIVSNKNNTTLYIGVTSNLQKRIYEHKNHLYKGFSDKYNCEKLVYFESFDNINQAIEREKYLKGKKRAFKENLINAINPKWLDLYNYLFCHSEALAEESQEIFRYAQYDKGDNLPQGWEIKTLGEIGKVVSGGTPSTSNKDNFDGEIAWITPADLSGYKEKYISKGKRNLSKQGLKNSSARLLPPNSILFSSRAPIGYVAIASNALCTNQGFKNLIPNSNVSSEYIYYFLLHSKRLAESVASGTTFKEISATNFSKLPIPLPPLATQNQIVQILESKFAHLEKLAQFVNASLENLQRLKSSLLNQAFKGELVC